MLSPSSLEVPTTDAPKSAAWLLVGLLTLALALTGAVGPSERAALHAVLAVLILASAGLVLDEGTARRWWTATLLLALPGLLALVPLPHALVALLAPGVADARPEGWQTLTVDLPATLDALLRLLLVMGTGVIALALMRRADPVKVERGVVWGGLGVALFGAVHALSGTKLLLGQLDVRPIEDHFLAPLINPNHGGLLVWLAVPFWAEAALRKTEAWWLRALCVVGVGWALWLPAYTASMGLVVVVAAVGLTALWLRPGPRWVATAGTLAVGVAAFGAGWTVLEQQPVWWRLSGEPRLRQWLDTAEILRHQPLTGLGFGAYASGYMPYRTVPAFASFEHAHSDLLEWLAETGLFGLVVGGLALRALPRPAAGAGRRPWLLALVALVAHALVDFPLQVPALALLGVVALAGWLRVGAQEDAVARPVVGRPAVAATAQLVAAAVLLCAGWADSAARGLLDAPTAEGAASLQRWAPWRPEGWTAAVIATPDPAERVKLAVATAPGVAWDAASLRMLGASLLKDKALDEAAPVLARAITRDPNDWRSWYLEGRRRHLAGDDRGAAEALATAMHHWPPEQADRADLVTEGYAWWPIGVWWVDRLSDAPAHASAKLAWLLLKDRDPETALLAAEQAARLRPEAHAFSAARVEALVTLGEPEAAAAHVEQWMQVHPEDPWAWIAAASLADRVDRPRWRNGVIVAGLLALDQPGIRRRLTLATKSGPPELQGLSQRLLDIADGKQEVRVCEDEVKALGDSLGVGGLVEGRSWRCAR